MKIQQLFLRNVRNIKNLDLDFRDPITGKPMSRVVLVGANGTGKTTVLESIYGLLATTGKYVVNENLPPGKLPDTEITIPLTSLSSLQMIFEYGGSLGSAYYGLTKDNLFKDPLISDSNYGWVGGHLQEPGLRFGFDETSIFKGLSRKIQYEAEKNQSRYGSVQYYPSTRYIPSIVEDNRGIEDEQPVYQWTYRYRATDRWRGSLESYLVWLDYLDAKDYRDQKSSVNRFSQAVELVNTILDGKRITRVENFQVIVETEQGETHGLSELSSGEKQVALLLVEILRRTVRESIILIDEPEISLHMAWQRGLVAALDKIIEQYDAQVILATHSVEIGSMVLPYEVISLNDLGMPLGKWEPEKEVLPK